MEEWLIYATEQAVVLVNAFALLVVLFGAIEAFVIALKVVFKPGTTVQPAMWLRLGRWLVAGLTFQLAADIIETAIAPSWDEIGRLVVIAVVRTFLNFFLERDMREVSERQQEQNPEHDRS